MKTKLIFCLLIFPISFIVVSAQVPQGMNYQALVRDAAGHEITNTTLQVKISVLSDTTGFYASGSGTYIWEEQQTVTTNFLGMFNLTVGNPSATKIQGSAATFSAINWNISSIFLGVKIFYQSNWKNMGTARLWSVPYSMRSKDTDTKQTLTLSTLDLSISGGNTVTLPAGSNVWQLSSTNIYRGSGYVGIGTTAPAYPLHVVGNSRLNNSFIGNEFLELNQFGTGNRYSYIDFHGDDTYTDYGLRIIRYNSGANSVSSVTHRGTNEMNFTTEQASPIRFYTSGTHSMTIAANGNIGIGNSAPAGKVVVQPSATWNDDTPLFEVKNKSGMTVFAVYNNGVRVYVEDDAPYKGTKGGFAIGGFNATKGGYTNDYMWVTPDSVRVYVDNAVAKGQKGGFAIGGFSSVKGTIPVTLTHLNEKNYLIGHQAGMNITSGLYNTFLGYQAGRSTTGGTPSGYVYPGWANVFIGYQTGYNNTTGFKNVFLGYQAGQDNIDGYYNTFIGNAAGSNNTTGVKNTFVGNESGEANISGSYNTFYGYNSGIMTGGDANTFVGADCGFYNTTGAQNAFLGSHAGEYFRGSYNTFLGAFAGRNYATIRTGNYNIFIGASAGYNSGAVSNKLYIDPSSTSSPLIYGDFTAGSEYVRINGNLEYTGTITDVSDERLKMNIRRIDDPVSKILGLNGVYFDWNSTARSEFVIEDIHQVGVIAQDVEKVLPEIVRINKEGYRTVDYTKITPLLIEALKEQQRQIEYQKQENEILRSDLKELKLEVEKMKTVISVR